MRVFLFCLAFFAYSFFVSISHADTVKVGAILPLSGEYAFVGDGVRKGMQAALKDNPNTKHQYKVIFEDSEFIPSKTALAAQKLINIDKADILTTIWGPEASVVSPLAENKKVIHLANDWDLLWTQKYKYTANISMPCDRYAEIQLKMFQRWKSKRVAIIYQNSADWIYALPYMLEAIKSDPSITLVASEAYISPVRDFRTTLAKINEKKPDTLLVWAILPESEIILRQARELGLNVRITGFFEDLSQKNLLQGESFICFTNTASEFSQKYQKTYHKDPPYQASMGYDQMTAVIKTFETSNKKLNAAEFLKAVKELPSWEGATGIIKPREDGILEAPFKVVKYQDGQMIPAPDFADLNKALGW